MFGLNKNILIWLVIILLFSCKARHYGFKPDTIITDSFRVHIDEYVSGKKPEDISAAVKGKVRETWIYQACIKEKLVAENAISEYKLMNTKSKKGSIDVESAGYYHILYLYLFKVSNHMQYGLFVSASYNPYDSCIGVGPAYIGNVESGKDNKTFSTQWQLKLKKNSQNVVLENIKIDSVILQFFSDSPMMSAEHNSIRFYQVIQKTGNKIGGIDKMLLYNVDSVFNDPDALVFELKDRLLYDENGRQIIK